MITAIDVGSVDWYIWRPVLARITTLREIEEHWSLNDLVDAHEALDVKMEIESAEHDKMMAESKGKGRK